MGILHCLDSLHRDFPCVDYPVWQTGLRHLIDVELRADHSALIISATVTDKVAVFLKLLECRSMASGPSLQSAARPRVENCSRR